MMRPSYALVAWLFWGGLTALFVIDRFTWQLTPRQGFSIGSGKAANDRTAIAAGPWTVAFYDVFARFSGRALTVCVDVLYVTMMRSLMHFLAESRAVNAVVDMSGAFGANARMHNVWGVATGVFTLVHIYSVFLPTLLDGWTLEVNPGTVEWPLSERAPPGFKDVDAARRHIMLQVDDVYRIVWMSVLFAVALPLTNRWLYTKRHIGIHLHNLAALLYFIDIVRRHSHPHNWVPSPLHRTAGAPWSSTGRP